MYLLAFALFPIGLLATRGGPPSHHDADVPGMTPAGDEPEVKQVEARPDPIDDLVARMGDRNPKVRRDALDEFVILQRPVKLRSRQRVAGPVVAALHDDDREVRRAAFEALPNLGPLGRQAIPLLEKMRDGNDEEWQSAAIKALVGLTPDAEEVLRSCQRDSSRYKHPEEEFCSIGAQLDYLTRAGYAVPDLLATFSRGLTEGEPPPHLIDYDLVVLENQFMIKHNLNYITDVHEWYDSSVPMFILNKEGSLCFYLIDDDNEEEERFLPHPAADFLVRCLNDADYRRRWNLNSPLGLRNVVRLAGALGPHLAGEAVEPVRKLLRHPERVVRVAAAEALIRLDPRRDPVPLRAIFEDALQDKVYGARRDAARALLRLDPRHRLAFETLDRAVRDTQSHRRGILDTIAEIADEGLAEPFIPALIEIIQDNDSRDVPRLLERIEAAIILGRIGPAARPAVPALQGIVAGRFRFGSGEPNYGDVFVEELTNQAIVALGRIGTDAESTVPAMIDVIRSRDYDKDGEPGFYGYSSVAARVLGSFGAEAAPAIPVLIEDLAHEFSSVRIDAAAALGRIGPPAKAAVPALRVALSDPRSLSRARVMAAQALWRIDRQYRESEPVLLEILRGAEYWFERRDAARVLGEIGRSSPRVASALSRAAIGDRDAEVRRAATTAFESLSP